MFALQQYQPLGTLCHWSIKNENLQQKSCVLGVAYRTIGIY